MLDKQFDNIINQKLKDVQMDGLESDWNVFSQKLKVAMESTDPSDHLFDEAIKSKLVGADIDIPKPEWSAFAAKLQADTTDISDADFDAVIKEKVENPDIEIPAADWPVFASLLAGSAITPEMSDSSFDQAIQDKLQDTSMDIPSPNWNAFSQKLQEATLSDQDLDSEVKSKLENHTTRYNESHWPILREKMIETRNLRRNLYGLKWFEAALAILLFMTFSNFVADYFIPDAKEKYAETTNASTTALSAEVNTSTTTKIATTLVSGTTASNVSQANNAAQAQVNNSQITTVSTEASNNVLVQQAVINEVVDTKNNIATENGTSGNNASTRNTATNTTTTNNSGSTTIDNTNNGGTGNIIAQSPTTQAMQVNPVGLDHDGINLLAISTIDEMTPGLFETDRMFDLDLSDAFSPVADKVLGQNGWAFHAVVGNNNHLISTPQDTFVYELPYTRSANNINLDLRVSKEFNNVELMTGIAYQSMQYGSKVTERITVGDEEYDFTIDEIKYDIIKIPLAARWDYGVTDKFSFFADIGVSANIIASTDYLIKKELFVEEGEVTKPQPTNFPPNAVFADWEQSSLNRKEFQEGLFDDNGASLKDALYGTLDTGIGINYKLSDQISTYARGTVNQPLGLFQIGPNYDSFTTFGLQVGLRYELGRF